MSNIYDLVIVGAGPGGLGAAIEAKANGLQNVLLIEKGDAHSQTIVKFYKDGKRVDKEYKGQDSTVLGVIPFEDGTKESTIAFFDKLIADYGVDVVFNSEVESVKKNGELFEISTAKQNYSAKNVIVSIGKMGKPNKPDYKIPLTLNAIVNFNLDKCSSGEKVLVVGGGNSAVEYAVDLCQNNTTTLAYRRDTFGRVNDTNLEALEKAKNEGKLNVALNHDISELSDEGGKAKVSYTNGNSDVYDRVIYAIGGSSPVDFLNKCGIKIDDKGTAIVDENYQTNITGLYASGDIVLKNGGSIVVALNHSYKIIKHIKG